MALRRDAFFGQIRIGAAFEQEFDDLEAPARGSVLYRRASTNVTGVVVAQPIDERWVLIE